MAHRLRRTVLAAGLVGALGALTGDLGAQTPTRVEAIRLQPAEHVNQIRTVEGVVDRLVNRPGDDPPSFYLEDDYGHQILVIPFDEAPARGDRVAMTGIVTLDPSGDPVITLFDAAAGPDGSASEGAPAADGFGEGIPSQTGPISPPAGGRSRMRLGLTFAGIVIAIGFVLVFVFNLGRAASGGEAPLITGPLPGKKEVDFATSALWPESDQEFDGRTMRFIRPDPTMQLMPARLEVIAGGDAGEEIRFVGVPGEKIEMMFGRSPGLGPSHVQLKQKTVSRTHAIVRHRHGEWLIENLSMTNPTVLNDEILGVKERLLTDGDILEMGEVTFRFRES